MNNITERIKLLKERWKEQSKTKKIVAIIMIIGIISALVTLKLSINRNKYGVLFSNMDTKDLGTVLAKLKEDKIDYKVEGNAIKVPKDKVDELRLQIPSEVKLSNGSVGFEIFDNNKFGMTDKEMSIEYQRALEGELERTVKSLPEVSDARVHIVMCDDSVFVREVNPAKASLTVKLNQGCELKKDQINAIVELLCTSIKKLDKKNVNIIAYDGNKTKLLTTPDLFKDDDDKNSIDTEEEQKMRNNIENKLENKIQTMLEKVYGNDNVVVKVNADLNFDAIQQKKIEYDPKGTVVKEHLASGTENNATATDNSPVDNQMVNQMEDNNQNTSTNKDEERDYIVSSDEQTIIKAPGAVEKITASVLLNENLDDATKTSITNLVSGVIGFNAVRGDSINVEGLKFDTTMSDKAKQDIDQMNKLAEAKRKRRLYTYGAIAGAVLIALIIFLLARRKARKDKEDEELEEILQNDADVEPKPVEQAPVINLEQQDNENSIEKQIKEYATNKPEQVAEIVRTWLVEDER